MTWNITLPVVTDIKCTLVNTVGFLTMCTSLTWRSTRAIGRGDESESRLKKRGMNIYLVNKQCAAMFLKLSSIVYLYFYLCTFSVVVCDAALFCLWNILLHLCVCVPETVTGSDFFFPPMKVISSTCPPSSKITGSSFGKNMEFSSFWTPYASITGETPFPKVHRYINTYLIHCLHRTTSPSAL